MSRHLNDSLSSDLPPDAQAGSSRRQFIRRLAAISAGLTVAAPFSGSATTSEGTALEGESSKQGTDGSLVETLALMAQGEEITTVEGLAKGDELHPVQAAFIGCDGFQCGYCTPGQIMSAVGCINEGHIRSDTEIQEFMSGNLCRCGAYPNIVDAIKAAAVQMKAGE